MRLVARRVNSHKVVNFDYHFSCKIVAPGPTKSFWHRGGHCNWKLKWMERALTWVYFAVVVVCFE